MLQARTAMIASWYEAGRQMIMSTGQIYVHARVMGAGNMGVGKGQVKSVDRGMGLPKWIMGARPQN